MLTYLNFVPFTFYFCIL